MRLWPVCRAAVRAFLSRWQSALVTVAGVGDETQTWRGCRNCNYGCRGLPLNLLNPIAKTRLGGGGEAHAPGRALGRPGARGGREEGEGKGRRERGEGRGREERRREGAGILAKGGGGILHLYCLDSFFLFNLQM